MVFTEPCPFKLCLHGLRLKVKLGCGAEERQVPQFVRFDIEIHFLSLPQGALSDSLDQTVCYAKLSDRVREICDQGEFCLIEKLGWDTYSALQSFVPEQAKLGLRITKESPPVPDLTGGASFSIGIA